MKSRRIAPNQGFPGHSFKHPSDWAFVECVLCGFTATRQPGKRFDVDPNIWNDCPKNPVKERKGC